MNFSEFLEEFVCAALEIAAAVYDCKLSQDAADKFLVEQRKAHFPPLVHLGILTLLSPLRVWATHRPLPE